jgi:hypothetical protein
MVSVNSAKSPKFKQHNFAAQILEAQGMVSINPLQMGGKIGSGELNRVHHYNSFSVGDEMSLKKGHHIKFIVINI